MERHLKITGHLFFLIYFLFAIIFRYERVLFTDSAFYLFKIIDFEWFNIEYARFSAILTQLPTLIGVKLHVPMNRLIACFSVSFVLVYYSVYLLSVYIFRNTAAGLAILLVLCLSIRHSFFHIVTETHQCLVYSCLFFAWMMGQKSLKSLPVLISGLLIVSLCCFAHPVAFLTIPFCIIYYILDKKRLHFSTVIILLIVVLLGVIKYLITPSGNYEGQFLSQIANLGESVKSYSSWHSKWFYWYHDELYDIPKYMIVIVSIYYFLTSQFLKFFFIPIYYFGFLFFAQLIFNAEDSQVMMERAFMPLSFFAGISFGYDFLLKSVRFRSLKFALVVAILSISLGGIVNASKYFTNRMDYIQQLSKYMDLHQSHKMIISWDSTSNKIIYIPWAFGVETLLYSTAKNNPNLKTIFIDDMKTNPAKLLDDDLFLCTHFDREWNANQLNPKYFQLSRGVYFMPNEKVLFNKKLILK